MAPGGTTSNENVFYFEDDEMGERISDEDLKLAINNLIWMHAPPSTTLEQAEEMALEWFHQLRRRWDEHCEQEKQKVAPGPPDPPRPMHSSEVA